MDAMRQKVEFSAYAESKGVLHTGHVFVRQAQNDLGDWSIETIQAAYDSLPEDVKDTFDGFHFGAVTCLDS